MKEEMPNYRRELTSYNVVIGMYKYNNREENYIPRSTNDLFILMLNSYAFGLLSNQLPSIVINPKIFNAGLHILMFQNENVLFYYC